MRIILDVTELVRRVVREEHKVQLRVAECFKTQRVYQNEEECAARIEFVRLVGVIARECRFPFTSRVTSIPTFAFWMTVCKPDELSVRRIRCS